MGDLFYIHNVCEDSRFPKSVIISIDQFPAISHICGNYRFVSRITLKDCQRLSFTDTGKQCEIHLAQIILYINPSCEFHILNPKGFYQIITFFCIFFIFICRSHNPELHIFYFFFGKSKCLYHGFNIFDRSYTKYSPGIDKLLLFFCLAGKICKRLCIDPIWCHPDLLRRTSQFHLQVLCMVIQTGYHICLFICKK